MAGSHIVHTEPTIGRIVAEMIPIPYPEDINWGFQVLQTSPVEKIMMEEKESISVFFTSVMCWVLPSFRFTFLFSDLSHFLTKQNDGALERIFKGNL
ncbi:hypothetical protein NPIL_434611 [Nephila pilipes]|uniref:Uncharacterized protein n=1 Tax=Nephila pilipes TaxID=299642 RepID=A0A8X6PGH4_NEPPI|nr:hypothetical protein NPIL_434611 [Nephila pilipes]